jgi:hypothetical protein
MGKMGGMGMGMGHDSTLSGQTYFLNINRGFCNENGPCTVFAGRVGVMFLNGTKADPSKGSPYPRLQKHPATDPFL